MPTTNEDGDDGDRINRMPIHMRTMELHHCGPGRAGHPVSGEQIAVITFVCNGRMDLPLMLPLRDVRRLVAKLIAVLDYHHDPLGQKLTMLFFPDGEWRTDPVGEAMDETRPMPKHRAKPSLRVTMPRKPVSDTDVWRMVRMLHNVRDHQTFMRLIGVPEADIAVDQRRAKGTTSKRSSGGPPDPVKRMKSPQRTPKRKR